MGRRAREDEPGSWHHVWNRGIAKRPLFEDRSDQRFFLARLVRQIRLGRIEVHAYCLLTTHFHLLVRSPIGRVSEAMRRVQNEHSRRFNRRRKRDGPLVRGRYGSKPAPSLTYRRILVRYIDDNPVTAGIVRSAAEHEHSSARAYLTGSGPRWLTRDWVEGEACELAGTERFDARVYRAAFGGGQESPGDLVEARMRSAGGPDPLDDLVAASPLRVRQWMQRKAQLADGCAVGVPICSARAVRTALAEDERANGRWSVEEGGILRKGRDLAQAGLLRRLCGLTWTEIGMVSGKSGPRAHREAVHHDRLMLIDSAYAERAVAVATVAIRCAAPYRQ